MAEKGVLEPAATHVRERITDATSELVVTAMGFLGVPYRRGGNSVETGFDCSGFVKAIYEQTVGLVLPRHADEQAAATQKIDKQDLQPGRPGVLQHPAPRLQPRRASTSATASSSTRPGPAPRCGWRDMGGSYWQRRFDGARRVLVAQPAFPG